jgi:tryptophanyl-tRNA synthetase
MKKETILTGIRSNGELTLGNYLGAIVPMVQLQQQKAGEYQLNFFVPDLHSFTTEVNHHELYQSTLNNLKIFVAAGLSLDNADTYIYRQSYIPAHSELFTILNNFAYFGELSRMTQFKEKSQEATNISSGLFTYPVLMAADILLYGAKYVPVGDDQRQHLELCRDLGIRFNNKFGEVFTVPVEWKEQLAFYQRDNGLRIRSLRNPEKKMSKSISDPAGTILLTDNPAEAAKKIMSATTDSIGEIQFDLAERPGISNLLQILAVITNRPQAEVNAEWAGKTAYGDLKKAVAGEVEAFLTAFQAAYAAVDETAVVAKLEQSEAYMRESTALLLERVQQVVGLRPKQ